MPPLEPPAGTPAWPRTQAIGNGAGAAHARRAALRVGLLSLIAPAVLFACDDPAPTPPEPTADAVVAADVHRDREVAPGIVDDSSVPAAERVVTTPVGDTEAAEGPAPAPLTKKEETQAMPKDGQANDPSTPKMGS